MSLDAEIGYVANMARVLNVPAGEVTWYLRNKPFCDPNRSTYIADIAQVLRLLPPPPGRLLDLGCGSGWTSECFAACGYQVLGVDVAPDMIAIARQRCREGLPLDFLVSDYASPVSSSTFAAVVLYDALHHATDAKSVIASAGTALDDDGLFISIEPGRGHADTAATKEAVARFGTTERDMPFELQVSLLAETGFTDVRQILRLSQLSLEDVSTVDGRAAQLAHFQALVTETGKGLTSIVTARKRPVAKSP
jgi:SAM-dependent methyltransferase